MNETATYLVIGASGGIGSALSRRLAAEGANLVLAAPDSERLRQLGADLHAQTKVTDASSRESVLAAVEAAQGAGDFRGVANCVGSILLRPAHLTTPEQLEEVVRLNLTTAFNTVAAAAPALRSGGSIVLFSSAAAGYGLPNHEAIAAAKAAVEGLARSAAATYARRGVRVNAVAPGLVNTALSSAVLRSDATLEASRAMHPLGRLGEPEDVAALAAWLLGDDSSWVTGQVYGCDGGLARVRPPATRAG
jgi:NAD(P)-dependent dehydrogenase (short-subunit alcohol dehydrogenase family)